MPSIEHASSRFQCQRLLALLEAHVACEQGRAPFGACAGLGAIERGYYADYAHKITRTMMKQAGEMGWSAMS